MSIFASNQFYVYVYLDPRKSGNFVYGEFQFDYEPFYVGKGTKNRYLMHLYEALKFKDINKLKCDLIREIFKETNKEPLIIKYKNNLTSILAINIEIDMIKTIGRIIFNEGPLTNISSGGEDLSGINNPMYNVHRYGKNNPFYGKHHSEETKRKLKLVNIGKKATIETKRKMSENRKGENNGNYGNRGKLNPLYGKSKSIETRKKLSEKMKGKILSEEHKHKISESNKGKLISEETKKKMSEAQKRRIHYNGKLSPNYGKHHSEETKKKISEAQKGKKISEQQKQNLSKIMKGKYIGNKNPNFGKKMSEEQKQKLSESHKGKKHSDESKRKISNKVSGNKNPQNKYNYILSNNENFWLFFTEKEKNSIYSLFFYYKSNTINYKGIIITKILK
jgi:hypothetical protein